MADARRITIIVDHLGAAGTQRQVAMLATELAAAGRDVEIVALEPAAMTDADTPAGVRVVACPVASLARPAALEEPCPPGGVAAGRGGGAESVTRVGMPCPAWQARAAM